LKRFFARRGLDGRRFLHASCFRPRCGELGCVGANSLCLSRFCADGLFARCFEQDRL